MEEKIFAFARYECPALAELGRELAATCEGIVTAGLGPYATPTA